MRQDRPEIKPGAPAILVVEDDRRMAGYRVCVAEDGECATFTVHLPAIPTPEQPLPPAPSTYHGAPRLRRLPTAPCAGEGA